MNLSLKKFFGFVAVIALVAPSMVFAQAANSDLESQVKELTKKVAMLESAKNSSSSFGGGYVMPTEGDAPKGGLIHPPQDIDFGGYVPTAARMSLRWLPHFRWGSSIAAVVSDNLPRSSMR